MISIHQAAEALDTDTDLQELIGWLAIFTNPLIEPEIAITFRDDLPGLVAFLVREGYATKRAWWQLRLIARLGAYLVEEMDPSCGPNLGETVADQVGNQN